MPIVRLTLESVCSGGGHFDIKVAVGSHQRILQTNKEAVLDPVDEKEIQAFCEVLLKLFAAGKTGNQIRTALQSGVDVVIP